MCLRCANVVKVDTDTFVEVSKEELENVALESTRTIEIDEFGDKSEIDPRYLIRPYYQRVRRAASIALDRRRGSACTNYGFSNRDWAF